MILLTATTHSLELVTSSTASTDWSVGWVDLDDNSLVTSGSDQGNVASATDTAIVAAPSSGQQRKVQFISACNKSSSTSNTYEINKDVSGTEYRLVSATLQPGEKLQYVDGSGFAVLDQNGRVKTICGYEIGYTGRTESFFKVGAGSTEAAGIRYLQSRDTGNPGSWVPGTPGLNGRTCDGTDTANDGGCLPYANAGTGENYLTNFTMAGSSTGTGVLIDVLWVNSGLVVTTLGAQGITSPTWPARDAVGGTNGTGLKAGILVTTATTNVGAVTNTTLNYTDSYNNGTQTGTIASFPATCTAGSVVPFQLASGDQGIKSIEGVTLGTSYGGGAISIIVYRELAIVPLSSAWISGTVNFPSPGLRLYDGMCMLPMFIPVSATTYNTAGSATWIER